MFQRRVLPPTINLRRVPAKCAEIISLIVRISPAVIG